MLENIINSSKEYAKGKKAVIFDLDGTIADSMMFWVDGQLWLDKPYEDMKRVMRGLYDERVFIKKYALEFLNILKQEKIPFCIATGTEFSLAEPFIRKYGLDRLYDFYISTEEIGKQKTQPDIYLLCAERMGADISETIIFEDLAGSAKTAKTAGACVVGVYDEFSKDKEEFLRAMCDDYIYGFDEMLRKI